MVALIGIRLVALLGRVQHPNFKEPNSKGSKLQRALYTHTFTFCQFGVQILNQKRWQYLERFKHYLSIINPLPCLQIQILRHPSRSLTTKAIYSLSTYCSATSWRFLAFKENFFSLLWDSASPPHTAHGFRHLEIDLFKLAKIKIYGLWIIIQKVNSAYH